MVEYLFFNFYFWYFWFSLFYKQEWTFFLKNPESQSSSLSPKDSLAIDLSYHY